MRTYANEAEYHQWFIDHIDQLFLPDRSTPILVIGHELSLFGGSRNGGSGSADLLAVDVEGRVWLIEAKVANSAEFGTVWEQLVRYRDSLQAHNRWDVLERQMLKFLNGREKCQPVSTRYQSCATLRDVLGLWLASLGRTTTDVAAFTAGVAEQLRAGTLGLAVLSDIEHTLIARDAERHPHGGPKAFFVARLQQGQPRAATRHFQEPGEQAFQASEPEHFYDTAYPVCRPETLAAYLDPSLIPLVEAILYPGLRQLGWDGRDYLNNRKSITVALPFADAAGRSCWLRLVDLGWTDADASRVASTQRLPGSYGLKVLFHPFDLHRGLGEDLAMERLNAWAPRLYACGWRGRGVARDIHRVPLTRELFRKFAKEFEYEPSPEIKDFTRGDAAERRDLQRLLQLLASIVEDIAGWMQTLDSRDVPGADSRQWGQASVAGGATVALEHGQ